MSARENDLLRIQEIYDIVTKTIAQVEELSLSKESFKLAKKSLTVAGRTIFCASVSAQGR